MKRRGQPEVVAGRSLAANTPMLLRAGLVEGRLDAGVLSSGQVAGVIDDLPTVAELIARIMSEAEQTLKRSGRAHVSKTAGAGRRELVHDGRGRARSCSARAASTSGSYFWPTAVAVSGNPSAPGRGARARRAVAHRASCGRGRRTTTRRPSRTSRPTRSCRTRCARSSSTPRRWSCSASSRPAPTPTQLEVGMEMELVLGPLYEDDEHEYVVWQWAPAAASKEAAQVSDDHDIAILGAGMHPWGKWGRNFVEYGVVAAQAALADAGVEWHDIQFVSGGETMRNGYPGYVAGATFAQALGWNGAQVASSYAACASGVTALATARAQILAGFCDVALVIGADTTPKGFLAPNKGERGDDPDWLRFRLLGATNPTYFGLYARRRMELFGATREDFARVKVKNARHGLEQPERALPQGSVDRRRAQRAARLRSARPARHLRDERRRGRARRVVASTTRRSRGVERPGPRARRSPPSRRATRRRRSSSRTSRPTARPAPAPCPSTASRSRSRCARTRKRARPRRPRLRRGVRPLHRDGARLVRADRAVRAGRGREAAPRRRDDHRRTRARQPERRPRVLRRSGARAGDRAGVRAHLAGAGPRRPAARSRARKRRPHRSTRASSATAPRSSSRNSPNR